MGKGWAFEKKRRAVQQKIVGGMDLVSKGVHSGELSKAELRAMIPQYDESMVRRIEPNVKRKKGFERSG